MFFRSWQRIFGNGFAPNQIFNAILRSAFSAAAYLATLKHTRRSTDLWFTTNRWGSKGICPLGRRAVFLGLPEKGRQGASWKEATVGRGKAKLFPLQGSSTALKDRTTKAKSSMVASSIPKDLFNHGNDFCDDGSIFFSLSPIKREVISNNADFRPSSPSPPSLHHRLRMGGNRRYI